MPEAQGADPVPLQAKEPRSRRKAARSFQTHFIFKGWVFPFFAARWAAPGTG